MDIATLEAEAEELIFPTFNEGTATELGLILVERARADRLPVVINIRTPDRTLFHASMPGTTPSNELWALRKSNTAFAFHEASYLIGTRNRAKDVTLARHGLSAADYADHGGAVPVRVAGTGVVAVATVSGLPQEDDHQMVVWAIRKLIGA